MAASQQKSIY